jgi:hypothetical protein
MAKLSNYRRIYKKDYPETFQEAIDILAITVNQSFDEVYQALNKNITFADNINATIATISVSVDANGTLLNSASFKLNTGQTSVQGIIVINATATVANSAVWPTSGVFVGFSAAKDIVTLSKVQGLQASITYQLTLLCI